MKPLRKYQTWPCRCNVCGAQVQAATLHAAAQWAAYHVAYRCLGAYGVKSAHKPY